MIKKITLAFIITLVSNILYSQDNNIYQKKWNYGAGVFSGYYMFSDGSNKNFRNYIPIGFAVNVSYKQFVVYQRGSIGYHKTNRAFNSSFGTWEKDLINLGGLSEYSLGYIAYQTNVFKLSPFIGVSKISVSPVKHQVIEHKLDGSVSNKYLFGLNFEIINSKNHSFFRLRYGYNLQQSKSLTGSMHYITIGYGGQHH